MIDVALPSNDIIELFDKLWDCSECNMIEDALLKKCTIDSFKVSYKGVQIIDFNEFKAGEVIINAAFRNAGLTPDSKSYKNIDEAKLYQAVLLLDTIYHTRLSNPYRFSLNLCDLLKKQSLCFDNKDAVVKTVNSITQVDKTDDKKDTDRKYAYSFATKFCNRINPKAFPIYDSYVAGLLIWYRDHGKSEESFLNNSLGNYETYKRVYDSLLDKYKVDREDYRKIDHFLWTYAKIIEAFKKQSFPSPISISFKP